MLVESEIYVDGHRTESCSLGKVRRISRERKGFAWVGLFEPTEKEFGLVTREFDLHELAVEDAIEAHQRPKVERYGDSVFVVLKYAWYRDETETVEFGEVHRLGPDFVVTGRHGKAPALDGLRDRLEGEPGLLREGPASVLYAVADHIVDDYEPVVDGLENDIEEIEQEVFAGTAGVSRRIYELSREVIEFRRAVQPLTRVLERLGRGDLYEMGIEIKRRLRDVHDHTLRTAAEQVDGFRELLSNVLDVNLTLVGVEQNAGMQRQNEVVQKISAWAAILIVPTIVTGVYGMNFQYMPELSWTFGYPFALALIALISGLLYLGFRRAGWL